MSKHDDDFWGSTGDWTSSTPRRTPRTDAVSPDEPHRTRPVEIIRRGWSQMLSGGANPTRSHGITRPAAPAAIFDDFGDDVADTFAYADDSALYGGPTAPLRQPVGPGPLIVPVEEPSRELTRELARSFSADADVAATADVDRHAHIVEDQDWSSWDDEFEPVSSVGALDPLLGKLGAVAVVGALIVPLLFNLSSDAGDTLADTVGAMSSTPATSPATDAILEPGAPVQLPADDTGTAPVAAPALAAAPAETTQSSDDTVVADAATAPAADVATPSEASTSEAAASTAAAAAAEPISRAAENGAQDTAAAEQPAAADTPAARVERVCAIDYDVVAGDYWIRLADGAGVPLAELLEANGASASTPLFPGRTICLPAGSTTPPPPTTAPATTAPATTAPATTAPATTAPTTTAPATTTTTTTAPTVPATSGDVKQIIRDVWPDDLEERALEIAYRESRYDPYAKNFCCYGVFQIYWNVHKGWLDDIGITNDQQLFDPETNARAAYALYQRAGGWGPWAV